MTSSGGSRSGERVAAGLQHQPRRRGCRCQRGLALPILFERGGIDHRADRADAKEKLATALERAIEAREGHALEGALHTVLRVATEQQCGRPLLTAAIDHEEQRLPAQQAVGAAERRNLLSIETLLQRHHAVLTVAPPDAAARDCLVIAKALVEADSAFAKRPSPDLEDRIVRALSGCLTEAPSSRSI